MNHMIARITTPISKTVTTALGLCLIGGASVAQNSTDKVLDSCLGQGNSAKVCICASVLLRTRLGEENYTRFGVISERITEINQGAAADEGEMDALTAEGFRYFVPHGQAISVCKSRLATGG